MNKKRLYRTEGSDAKIFGVCGGLAEYFNVDVVVVRVITVVLFFCASLGLWPYLIAALIMPRKSSIY